MGTAHLCRNPLEDTLKAVYVLSCLPGMVTHTCIPNMGEAEAGGSRVPGQYSLKSGSKATLGYREKSVIET